MQCQSIFIVYALEARGPWPVTKQLIQKKCNVRILLKFAAIFFILGTIKLFFQVTRIVHFASKIRYRIFIEISLTLIEMKREFIHSSHYSFSETIGICIVMNFGCIVTADVIQCYRDCFIHVVNSRMVTFPHSKENSKESSMNTRDIMQQQKTHSTQKALDTIHANSIFVCLQIVVDILFPGE